MRRQVKPLLTSSLLLLYAGTMLLGQALHQWSGCGHHSADSGAHTAAHASDVESVSAIVDEHDAASCAICQFHTQAQLAAPAVAVCWQSLECRDLPSQAYLSVAAQTPGSYSSRAPPRA